MKKIIIFIAMVLLSGCAQKSRFDCPYGKGPTCASMDVVDKMIKAGNNDINEVSACAKNICVKSTAAKHVKISKIPIPEQTEPNEALRLPEEIMQLWIAPYEASNGIYYQQAFINIIVKDATWRAPVFNHVSDTEAYNG